jgi:hypothetical protein
VSIPIIAGAGIGILAARKKTPKEKASPMKHG